MPCQLLRVADGGGQCGLPIEAWEAKNGKKLEDGLYRGTLRRGRHHAGCGCAVGEQGEEVHIQPIADSRIELRARSRSRLRFGPWELQSLLYYVCAK